MVAGRPIPHHSVPITPPPGHTLTPLPILPSNDHKPCPPVDWNTLEPDPSLLENPFGFEATDWYGGNEDLSFQSFKDWPHATLTKNP
jgi:hypothetical protein